MTESLDNKHKRLKDYRFPKILLSISVSGKTGTLYLKNWPAEKLIYVKNGSIIFASSNVEEDCLGINLMTRGRITVSQYYESIRLLEKTGKRHGSILVELGYLTQKEIEDVIKKQVEEIVFSIFKWEDGYFFFEEAPFNIDEPITLESDTIKLIYKGIKKMDSFPQLRNALPLTTILTQSTNAHKLYRKFSFKDTEKEIISLVDGRKTVLDIVTNFRGNDLETLKVLYALSSIGAMIPVDYSSASKEDMLISEMSSPEGLYKKGTELFMSGKYSASVNAFREAVNLNPDNASYYFYLAMSLINTSTLKEAEDALIKAIEIEPFNDDYYTELGKVYTERGLTEKAGKTFEFALRINPHNERARHALSEIKNL